MSVSMYIYHHATSILPGGVRAGSILSMVHEVVDVLATLGMRIDILSVVLLSHRV